MAVLVRDVLSDAFSELGLFSPTTPIPPSDQALALNKFGRLIDNWNAIREAIVSVTFVTFPIVPNTQPSTIGPDAATYFMASRPVEIIAANTILNSGVSAIREPIWLHDDAWWMRQTMPNIGAPWATDGYYAASWPSATDRNGRLFLWPVPTDANTLELELRAVLASLGINDAFAMPPGYRDAITLTLAESLIVTYGKGASPSTPKLVDDAKKARARIFDLNQTIPTVATQDAGMPRHHGRRSNWNYSSGMTIPTQ